MAIIEFGGGDLRKHLERKTKPEIVSEYMSLLRAYELAAPGRRIMEAELAVDVYAGERGEGHEPYWRAWGEGDKDGAGAVPNPLMLDLATFRPGTKVFVYEPECPECHQPREMCEGDDTCAFDWRHRDELHYG